MRLRQLLDQLAVTISFASADEEAGLREVLEHLHGLETFEGGDLPDVLVEALGTAARRVEALIGGTDQESEGVLPFIEQVHRYACEVNSALESGASLEGLVPAWLASDEEEEDDIDDELIGLFVSGCTDTLKDVEGQLLELENNPEPADTIAEIRRHVHTFKGECGVLSLEIAQVMCHEAETMIDRTEATGSIPVDLMLDLVDWLRRHVCELSESLCPVTPGQVELLERLKVEGIDGHTDAGAQQASEAAAEPEAQAQAAPEAAPELETAAQPEAPRVPKSTERVSFDGADLDDETLPEFLEESMTHLEDVEAALLEMDENPEDTESLNRAFRAFHTIKGVAGFLNLEPIVRLAHRTETLLEAFRSEALICTHAHTDLVLMSKDMMAEMMSALAGEAAPLCWKVDELVVALEQAIKGEIPMLTVTSAVASEVTEEEIPMEQAAAPAGIPMDDEEEELAAIAPSSESTVEATPASQAASAPVAGSAPAIAEVDVPTPKEAPAKARRVKSIASVKVGTQRLDSLVDMVGELLIAQQMVTQEPALKGIVSEDLARKLSHVAKITRDLQEGAMSLRMVTLNSTFQKMTRLVRDVAKKSKKQVALAVLGEDTELDRNVVEQIADPLVHLIRNAVDHGLESTADRIAAGKPAKGTVQLNAYHQGGSIVIDVSDDGGGLNCDRILAKAKESGLVSQDVRREDIGDEEIQRMIFQAGFSTAAEVSDISGRGVGMDVVRRNIEGMRGRIDIKSELGKGTTMSLRLPLTLAIIDGMVVSVGSGRFIIPTLNIEQSFQPTTEQLHSVLGEGSVVNVRGKLLPIQHLKHVFGLYEGIDELEEGILLLVESNGTRSCILVDEIIGQQQVVIKNLGKALPPMGGVSGGAILGDGRVALIVDVDGLVAKAQGLSV
ncbi:MAG: two-component system chemotaxis sensor kinase CheA [Planctomycetota bacterium]|jgi:two-component system chemotaxis sensor kinase CheA